MRRNHIIVSAAVIIASAALVAACSPGGTGSSSKGASTAPTAVSTTFDTSTPVTLNLAYCDTGAKGMAAAFTKKYPNVTFTEQQEDCNNYTTDVVNKMKSSTPPDIIEYAAGPVETLVPGGYVMNLDKYASAYNWGSTFPKSLLNMVTFSSNATTRGTGSLYGVPGEAVFTGVFYNKSLMTKAGISSVPTTIDEFQADLAKAKAAGITPIALGAKDSGGIHIWGSLATNLTSPTEAQNWVFGKSGSSLNDAGATQAATYVQQWEKDGYFSASPNGVTENDATAAFAKGSALFTINGSYAVGANSIPQGDQFGFFAFPGQKASDPTTGMGFMFAFAMSSKTKHADVAAAFLNFMGSQEIATVASTAGMLPVNPGTAPAPSAGVATDIMTAYKKSIADNGIVEFYDHATPTMGDTITQNIQGVIAGQVTPAAAVAAIQADWAKTHS